MDYGTKTQWLEGIGLMALGIFLGTMLFQIGTQNPTKAKKEPKPLRTSIEITNSINSAHMQVEMYKMAFDTGYRACLLEVINKAIEANDKGKPSELYDFIYAKAKEVRQ